jgi:hypothetical protein
MYISPSSGKSLLCWARKEEVVPASILRNVIFALKQNEGHFPKSQQLLPNVIVDNYFIAHVSFFRIHGPATMSTEISLFVTWLCIQTRFLEPTISFSFFILLKSWATQNFITIKTSSNTNDNFVSNLIYYFNNIIYIQYYMLFLKITFLKKS